MQVEESLFPQHAQAASCNEQGTDDNLHADWFFQKEEGEEDGDDYAELVDRRHTRAHPIN